MSGRILAKKEGPIGWLIFDHPERRNAISVDMWRAIPDAVELLADDGEVRVLVLRGSGDLAFISGADISEFQSARSGEAITQYDADSASAFLALSQCDKPVIAMIHGFCIGGGVAIALTADLRYAADDAAFAIPAARLGLGYPAFGLESLLRVVGSSSAKEIFFTARRFSAEEALARKLVDEVRPKAELEDFVRKTATMIAENAPLTVKSAKLILGEIVKSPSQRDYRAMEDSVAACFASEDYMEGVRAFIEKRKPSFKGQ